MKPEPSRPSSEQQQPVFRASPSITALQKQQSAVQVTPLSPSKIQIKVKPQVGPTKLSKASEVFAGGRVSSAAQNLGGMYTCAGCSGTATMAETTRESSADLQTSLLMLRLCSRARWHPLPSSLPGMLMRQEAGQQREELGSARRMRRSEAQVCLQRLHRQGQIGQAKPVERYCSKRWKGEDLRSMQSYLLFLVSLC